MGIDKDCFEMNVPLQMTLVQQFDKILLHFCHFFWQPVANSSLSQLVARFQIFRFDAYVL